MVRVVQQARRDADLDVSDRIVVSVSASDEVRAAVAAYGDFVSREVLADSVDFAEGRRLRRRSATVRVTATVGG